MLKGPTPHLPFLFRLASLRTRRGCRHINGISALHATTYELQVALDFEFQLVIVDTTTTDTTAAPSTVLDDTLGFYWRVCGIDSAGAGQYSAVSFFTTGTLLDVKGASTNPKAFALYQNYPNRQPDTVISYQIPVTGKMSLKVYNLLGRSSDALRRNSESRQLHPHV